MPAALCPRIYTVLSAADLVARGLAGYTVLSGNEINSDPIPTYGELRLHTFRHKALNDLVYQLEIPNAVVHGPEGVVTIDRYALAESLTWTDPERSNSLRQDGLWISLNAFVGRHIAIAEHLLCGYYTNYYHWLIDGLGRFAFSQARIDLLVPRCASNLRKNVLQDSGRTVIEVGPSQAVAVDCLFWTSNMTGFGGAFHPGLRTLGDRMFPTLVPGPDTKIYVSRRDSQRRRLINEEGVEDFCRSRGFVVVTPSSLSVTDQARLFRGARWIIAPHGASLVNSVFSHPGTAILELLMDTYLNWCNRQLAACMQLRYGCVVGRSEAGDPKWVHGTPWTIDLDRLALAVDDPVFGACAD